MTFGSKTNLLQQGRRFLLKAPPSYVVPERFSNEPDIVGNARLAQRHVLNGVCSVYCQVKLTDSPHMKSESQGQEKDPIIS